MGKLQEFGEKFGKNLAKNGKIQVDKLPAMALTIIAIAIWETIADKSE